MYRFLTKCAAAVAAVLATAAIAFGQAQNADVRQGDVRPLAKNDIGPRERNDEIRDNIAFWEHRVKLKLAEIDKIRNGLDLREIRGQKIAISALLELYEEMDQEAKAIVDAHSRLGPDLKLYREALLKAPGLFQKTATALDARAAESNSVILKEAYSDVAAEARKLATAYEERARGIDGLEAEIAKKMKFVEESRTFIREISDFLSTIPADEGLETEKFVRRLNTYVEIFRDALNALKGVADKIGKEPPAESTPQPKAAPAPVARPEISIEEFQQRLASLKR